MPVMKQEDVLHLASLARIELSAAEVAALQSDLQSIVAYVGTVSEIAATHDAEPTTPAVYNVFREDVVTTEPGAHTEALLAEMPATEDAYLRVQKILKTE